MTREEMFLKSHEQLINMVRNFNLPIVLVQRGSVSDDALERLIRVEGGEVIGTHDNAGIEFAFPPFPKETVTKIVDTFLESHKTFLKE